MGSELWSGGSAADSADGSSCVSSTVTFALTNTARPSASMSQKLGSSSLIGVLPRTMLAAGGFGGSLPFFFSSSRFFRRAAMNFRSLLSPSVRSSAVIFLHAAFDLTKSRHDWISCFWGTEAV